MRSPEQFRVTPGHPAAKAFPLLISDKSHGNTGLFLLPRMGATKGAYFMCIAADGLGWEHVSVSIPTEKRCPTWEEMCYIKDLFFEEHECVVQYHPAKKDYVNNHKYCLHLWRPLESVMPTPPSIMVGV